MLPFLKVSCGLVFLVTAMIASAQSTPDEVVDVLSSMHVRDLPEGVSGATEMCPRSKLGAIAYHLGKEAMLKEKTAQLFPNGFPYNFSILMAVRIKSNTNKARLLSVYTEDEEKQLGVTLGTNIELLYGDADGINILTFSVNISDDKWHLVNLIVAGNMTTLVLDCKENITQELPRDPHYQLNSTGYTLVGRDWEGHYLYLNDVQLLKIASEPNAANKLCEQLAPSCEQARGNGYYAMINESEFKELRPATFHHRPSYRTFIYYNKGKNPMKHIENIKPSFQFDHLKTVGTQNIYPQSLGIPPQQPSKFPDSHSPVNIRREPVNLYNPYPHISSTNFAHDSNKPIGFENSYSSSNYGSNNMNPKPIGFGNSFSSSNYGSNNMNPKPIGFENSFSSYNYGRNNMKPNPIGFENIFPPSNYGSNNMKPKPIGFDLLSSSIRQESNPTKLSEPHKPYSSSSSGSNTNPRQSSNSYGGGRSRGGRGRG